MSKGMWVLAAVVAAITAGYCGYKWLETSSQKNALNRENNDLRNQNNNTTQQNDSLRQQNTAVVQENSELKNKVAKLTALQEPPPQTA